MPATRSIDKVTTRRSRVKDILTELGLNSAHLDILEGNPSRDCPYHNNEHLYTVALNCDEAARFYSLSPEDHRILFLSALYHDYNHSAGKTADTINISRAISAAVENISLLENSTNGELDIIADVIHATIQPPILHNTEIGLMHRIIMDADVMQSCEPDADKFLSGLAVELGKELKWSTTEIFLDQYNPLTSWCKEKIAALNAER